MVVKNRREVPARGRIVLWAVAVLVLTIGLLKAASRPWKYE
jgi:hypothetical protein